MPAIFRGSVLQSYPNSSCVVCRGIKIWYICSRRFLCTRKYNAITGAKHFDAPQQGLQEKPSVAIDGGNIGGSEPQQGWRSGWRSSERDLSNNQVTIICVVLICWTAERGGWVGVEGRKNCLICFSNMQKPLESGILFNASKLFGLYACTCT